MANAKNSILITPLMFQNSGSIIFDMNTLLEGIIEVIRTELILYKSQLLQELYNSLNV